MPRTAPRRDILSQVQPRIKVWLEWKGRYVFGQGIGEILAAVDRTGSIKEAARELGKSYRYVWGRVKEAEMAVGRPLVEAHVGGAGPRRSFLTDAARRLVDSFTALRARMLEAAAREYARAFHASS